jgi:hypothetical protein
MREEQAMTTTGAAADPAVEQPEAFLRGLHAALGPAAANSRRQP